MTDFKKSKAPNTTETKDVKHMAQRTGNMYEAVAITVSYTHLTLPTILLV